MTPNLKYLIKPRSIAFVGASADPTRIGGIPLSLLRDSNFSGQIYPINPKYDELFGWTCYKDLLALPAVPDLVVLAVSADASLDQLAQCGAMGVKAAILYAAGFAETGDEAGQARHRRLLDIAAQYDMAVAGPNCMGFVNYTDGALTTFAAFYPPVAPAGSVAIVGQSGAMCVALYNMARKKGVDFSHIINSGNEACIEATDYLEALLDDPNTHTVLTYLEHIRDGAKFLAVARRYRALGKTLAILKVGASEKGAEATSSHTAALSGRKATYDAAFALAGVIVARDLSHLADIAYISRFREMSCGLRVGLVSVSGAAGAGLSDQFALTRVQVPTLAPATQERLKSKIPSYGMISNPVDVTANVVNNNDSFDGILKAVAEDASIDMVLLYAPGRWLASITPTIIRVAAETGKLFAVIDLLDSQAKAALEEGRIAYFDDMHRATQALASWGEWSSLGSRREPSASPSVLPAETRRLIAGHSGAQNEIASKALLASVGIPVVQDCLAASPDEALAAAARQGYPVVLKVASADIAHKTNVGGVRLNIAGPAELRQAYAGILSEVGAKAPHAVIDGITVQPQVEPSPELLLGATRDAVFGWLITVGLGGTWTELIGDVVHRLAPVDADEARAMLAELKCWPLLAGFRGAPPRDVDAAAHAIVALSDLVLGTADALFEVEVNPLLVRQAGKGVIAADALVVFQGESAAPHGAETA